MDRVGNSQGARPFRSLRRSRSRGLPASKEGLCPAGHYRPPEIWVQRAYPNLIHFHEVDKGGHFAAWEQPELFAAEVQAAFRSLR